MEKHPRFPKITLQNNDTQLKWNLLAVMNCKNMFGYAAAVAFLKILKFIFIKIEYDLYVLDRFDVLISKIIFKK